MSREFKCDQPVFIQQNFWHKPMDRVFEHTNKHNRGSFVLNSLFKRHVRREIAFCSFLILWKT